jgi:hypothetical protein
VEGIVSRPAEKLKPEARLLAYHELKALDLEAEAERVREEQITYPEKLLRAQRRITCLPTSLLTTERRRTLSKPLRGWRVSPPCLTVSLIAGRYAGTPRTHET